MGVDEIVLQCKEILRLLLQLIRFEIEYHQKVF